MKISFEDMSIRQKIGQLFIVECPPKNQIDDFLKTYPVGGFVFFRNDIKTPEELENYIKCLYSTSKTPLFLAVDEEGGLVSRLAKNEAFDVPIFENAFSTGKTGNIKVARERGFSIGTYLKKYGFNMNFAPVADVWTNPNNKVIGERAFSNNPAIVAEMAEAMAEGLHSAGIIPTFKHFPGHGDTEEDSHEELALNRKTKEEMEKCEWIPFTKAGEKDCVMVGHIAVPNITGDFVPASLSQKIVQKILREEIGFQGLIVTDSMKMKAIAKNYDSGMAAVEAIKAGCDLILMPEDLDKAFDAIEEALQKGEISESRIEESLCRIYKFKKPIG